MQVTANQLAKQMGVDYVVVASLLKLAVAKGQAREVGKIKTSPTGKGKPSTVYEVPDTLTISLKALDDAATAVADEPLTLPQEPQAAAA